MQCYALHFNVVMSDTEETTCRLIKIFIKLFISCISDKCLYSEIITTMKNTSLRLNSLHRIIQGFIQEDFCQSLRVFTLAVQGRAETGRQVSCDVTHKQTLSMAHFNSGQVDKLQVDGSLFFFTGILTVVDSTSSRCPLLHSGWSPPITIG